MGADVIRSNVRDQMLGETKTHYSGYTCYTGISDFCPADIDTVGYRVFLGNGRYFVSSDVGGGKMQWYAFHQEPAGGSDGHHPKKERLMQLFGDWCDAVTDLVRATPEADVLRRDIFDRAPIFQWTEGRAALLGDAAHAMQPNLGQGGCMAIEDAFVLAEELDACPNLSSSAIHKALITYQGKRLVRAASIHGMARMAAFMASTYKTHLGEGVPGVGEALAKLRIPHPGRVVGYYAMMLTMPAVLDWVLGGFAQSISHARVALCTLREAPQTLPRSRDAFASLLHDESQLLSLAHSYWVLMRGDEAARGESVEFKPIHGVDLGSTGCTTTTTTTTTTEQGEGGALGLGSTYRGPVSLYACGRRGLSTVSSSAGNGSYSGHEMGEEEVPVVAVVDQDEATGLFYVQALEGGSGLVVLSYREGTMEIPPGGRKALRPGDELALRVGAEAREVLVVKTRHVSARGRGAGAQTKRAAGAEVVGIEAMVEHGVMLS